MRAAAVREGTTGEDPVLAGPQGRAEAYPIFVRIRIPKVDLKSAVHANGVTATGYACRANSAPLLQPRLRLRPKDQSLTYA